MLIFLAGVNMKVFILGKAGLNNSIGPIARNCPKWPSGNRICGLKLPAKLVFWKVGQQTFCCIKQLLTAHPMLSWFWEVICKVTVKFNHYLFIISIIPSPLYSIWLYDQLGIAPWFELEIVDQWSTRIPPPDRRGWHCSKSQGSYFESNIADNR